MYHYRYEDQDGNALETCPNCGHDLTNIERGVVIAFSAGEHIWEENSNLDHFGRLIDYEGNIRNGLHGGTYCGSCDILLIDMSDVVEIVDE